MNQAGQTSPIRVLLIEDSEEVRQRMRTLIEDNSPAVVIGEAVNAAQALEILKTREPDVVLLSMNLADGRCCKLLTDLKRLEPACVVIVMTLIIIPGFQAQCLRLGADYFFNLSLEFERVPEVLRQLRSRNQRMHPTAELP